MAQRNPLGFTDIEPNPNAFFTQLKMNLWISIFRQNLGLIVSIYTAQRVSLTWAQAFS